MTREKLGRDGDLPSRRRYSHEFAKSNHIGRLESPHSIRRACGVIGPASTKMAQRGLKPARCSQAAIEIRPHLS